MSELRSAGTLARDAATGLRFGLVVSRYHDEITGPLRDAAVETLLEHGAAAADIETVEVPGAYELPMGALALARERQLDAVICIGALIRGETAHFDVLAHAVAVAVQDAVRETGVPMAFGVLTCDVPEQAAARAGGVHGNKGVEAALAAIEMARLYVALQAG